MQKGRGQICSNAQVGAVAASLKNWASQQGMHIERKTTTADDLTEMLYSLCLVVQEEGVQNLG